MSLPTVVGIAIAEKTGRFQKPSHLYHYQTRCQLPTFKDDNIDILYRY